jgi:hypothetical protein
LGINLSGGIVDLKDEAEVVWGVVGLTIAAGRLKAEGTSAEEGGHGLHITANMN